MKNINYITTQNSQPQCHQDALCYKLSNFVTGWKMMGTVILGTLVSENSFSIHNQISDPHQFASSLSGGCLPPP